MHFSYARLLSFAAALNRPMVAVYLFMKRTFTGTAIRAISQDRQNHVADGGSIPSAIYLITSALGGALAGLGGLPPGAAIRRASVRRAVVRRPITFLICVLGGLGNFVGGFHRGVSCSPRSFRWGGLVLGTLEWGYVAGPSPSSSS